MSIDIQLDGDNCWPEIRGKVIANVELTGVALLPDGEVIDGVTGARKRVPILLLRVDLPDGTVAIAQIKVEMLNMIASAMKGRLEYLAELKAKGGVDS